MSLPSGKWLHPEPSSTERGHPEGRGDGASAGQHPEDERPRLQSCRPSLRRPAGEDLPGHAQCLQVPE